MQRINPYELNDLELVLLRDISSAELPAELVKHLRPESKSAFSYLLEIGLIRESRGLWNRYKITADGESVLRVRTSQPGVGGGGEPDDAGVARAITLAEIGTPWAEEYRGNGRLTGHLYAEPVYDAAGDVAPGWRYVGDMTEHEFYRRFEYEQHDYFHSPDNADWACEFCVAAGWAQS